jgi:hypothetical protein
LGRPRCYFKKLLNNISTGSSTEKIRIRKDGVKLMKLIHSNKTIEVYKEAIKTQQVQNTVEKKSNTSPSKPTEPPRWQN